jgi:hypothetical protein
MTSQQVVTFEGVTKENLPLLKDLNIALFPIKYQVPHPAHPRVTRLLLCMYTSLKALHLHSLKCCRSVQDKIYQQILQCGDVSQLAMLGKKCIGAIGCRLQMVQPDVAKLYILTLGVLAPFRNQGVGTMLVAPPRSVIWSAHSSHEPEQRCTAEAAYSSLVLQDPSCCGAVYVLAKLTVSSNGPSCTSML